MKRFALCLMISLFCPLFGQSQGTTAFHRIGQILTKAPSNIYAQVVPYATVTVTDSFTGLPATIYSDPGLTVQITPPVVTTDGTGNYDYYFAANFCVTENISSVSQGEFVIANVCNYTAGLGNPVPISQGGTNATTAAAARTNLGVAASGANSDITSLTGLTTPLPISEGGTGSATASANRVFAGPTSGGSAAPSFRLLVSADIPSNSANTSGNAATATALAALPTQCGGGQFSTGIAANGNANCALPPSSTAITQIGGVGSDATTPSGGGIQPLTLSTVNGAPGACGDSTHVCVVTTNGKGLVTNQTATAISFPTGGTQKIVAATSFSSCTLGDDGTGGSGAQCTQSWGTTISGSYYWWCQPFYDSAASCANIGNCSALLVDAVSSTATTFTYFLNTRTNTSRGHSIPMTCLAAQ